MRHYRTILDVADLRRNSPRAGVLGRNIRSSRDYHRQGLSNLNCVMSGACAADINCDGRTDVLDIQMLANVVLGAPCPSCSAPTTSTATMSGQGGYYGIFPFASLGNLYSINSRLVAGVAAAVYNTGTAQLMLWDALTRQWQTAGTLALNMTIRSVDLTWRSDGITLRLNRQDTTLKVPGILPLAPINLDRLWLIAGGAGTHVSFDAVCADASR